MSNVRPNARALIERARRFLDREHRGAKRSVANLAVGLQGGGAFGAYAWGVLDYLLAETDAEIDVLTGASAGALNAAVCATGLAHGGREGARQALAEFWTDTVRTAQAEAPGVAAAFAANQFVSFFGPAPRLRLPMSPLRALIARHVDVDALAHGPEVHVSAIRVQDWRPRVFTGAEITPEVLAASCCLPAMHEDAEIDGERHWDGGYAANPPLPPLRKGRRRLVVAVTPPRPGARAATAATAKERIEPGHFSAPFAEDLDALMGWRPEILDATPHLPAFNQAGAPTRRLIDRLFRSGHHDAADWASLPAKAAE